ncbi:MAG: G5 domain-containing protein [Ndongobacter sp.]|nr:G5 domain-containing protein [Ndongobacter sp.]
MNRTKKMYSLLALLLLLSSCGSAAKYELVEPEIPLEAIEKRLQLEFVDIDFDRVVEKDDSLTPGTYYLAQRGRKGQTEVQYTVIYVNGIEARRYEISKRIVKQPIREILVLGPALRDEDAVQERISAFSPPEVSESRADGASSHAADASSSPQNPTPNDSASESALPELPSSQVSEVSDSSASSEPAPGESSPSESSTPDESDSSSGDESSGSPNESSDDASSSSFVPPPGGEVPEQPPEEALDR